MKELFGQRLREQRQNQGLTMEQLAEKANLSTNFIGAIERGLKEPSLSTLISILNALDIPRLTFCSVITLEQHPM